MNFYCPDCDWVGYEEEVIGDDAEDACPGCGGVRVYRDELGESDDDEEQTFRNVESAALCYEFNKF